jgi:hypothetical protein
MVDIYDRDSSFGSAYRREVKKIWQIDFLRDQPQRASAAASSHDFFYPSHNIFYRLGVHSRNDFKRAIASRAAPKVTYLPSISILGPFGSNQLIVASNAICPETRTTFGWYHSHGYSPADCLEVARRGNRSMALSSAAIHLNLTREIGIFLDRHKCIRRIKNLPVLLQYTPSA